MKRIISLILVTVLLVFTVISASASDITLKYKNSKISYNLMSEIKANDRSGEILKPLRVCIWPNIKEGLSRYAFTGQDIELTNSTNKTDMKLQYDTLKKYYRDYSSVLCNVIINEMSQMIDPDDTDHPLINEGTYISAYLTKDMIYTLSNFIIVKCIDIYSEAKIDKGHENNLFFSRFMSSYFDTFKDNDIEVICYEEEYYHYSTENLIDWVLIKAQSNMYLEWFVSAVFGNRVTPSGGTPVPFNFLYGIYDVENDMFFPLEDVYNKSYKYKDIKEITAVFDTGVLIGDIDRDDMITISDATELQMCLANIKSWRIDDEISGVIFGDDIKYISDFNRDSFRDIADATSIQMYLADLANPFVLPDDPRDIHLEFEDFNDIYNKNHIRAFACGGTEPYLYNFTISFSADAFDIYKDYGYFYPDPDDNKEPDDITNTVTLISGLSKRNTISIPTKSIPYGTVITLTAEAIDADMNTIGSISKQITNTSIYSFTVCDPTEPPEPTES